MKLIPVYGLSLVRDSSVRAESRKADAPAAVAEILKSYLAGKDRENFVVVMVGSRQRVLGLNTVSVGTLSASLVHPREVFKPAILASAAGIIVSHNHPSGDCQPSAEDRECTRRLCRAGELLGIPVLDHVIVGDGGGDGPGWFSFKEHGLMA